MASKDLEQDIISEVEEEKRKWEDALVFITENVAFKSRDLIRSLRKNYWGVYDNPKDPTTGRKKIWVPLTEQMVETHVKQTDFDMKDMRFRANNPKGRAMTDITRAYVRNYLDKTGFGRDLNQSNRQMNIDGTMVWKTVEKGGIPRRKNVDLLNFFIDPMADSIQEAGRVTERILMTPEEVKSHGRWKNTEEVEGSKDLQKIASRYDNNYNEKSNIKYVDVWEMWGLVPEYFLTGNKEDTKQVEAQIVVSGLEAGTARFHYAKKNTTKDKAGDIIKPYEECWHTKVQNRWYGRGPAEKVIMLQLWLNTVVNVRINRSILTQMGLFKIRKGAGITPKQLQNVPQNGAIVVNSMDDIENFAIEDVKPSAYNEETQIVNWAQRVTSAYDQVAGEALPAETPATNASIQNQNAQSTFTLVKENIGDFLERWMDRHALPILAKNVETGELIRIVGDDKEIQRAFDRVVGYRTQQKLDEFENQILNVRFRDPQDLERVMKKAERLQEKMQEAVKKLREDPDVFAEMTGEIMADQLDTDIYFTNEEINTSVVVSNLLNMLQVAPEFKDEIVREVFNLMNIDVPDPAANRAGLQQLRSIQNMEPETQDQVESQGATMNNPPRRRVQPTR